MGYSKPITLLVFAMMLSIPFAFIICGDDSSCETTPNEEPTFFDDDNFTYAVTDEGKKEVFVCGFSGRGAGGTEVNIPETAKDKTTGTVYTVVGIESDCFKNASLTKITIGSNVDVIGARAFYKNPNVTSIMFKGDKCSKLEPNTFDLNPVKTENEYNLAIEVISPNNWAKDAFVGDVIGDTSPSFFAFKGLYSVEYDLDGGSGTAPTQEPRAEGETFELASYDGTKDGYTFKGWSDGTKTYQPGETYTIGSKNVKFTAVWEKNATGLEAWQIALIVIVVVVIILAIVYYFMFYKKGKDITSLWKKDEQPPVEPPAQPPAQ